LLRWEARLVRARLLSTGSGTVYMFSPNSHTRTYCHLLLNPRQSNNMCSTRWILRRRCLPVCTHAHVFQRAHACTARVITWSCQFARDTRCAYTTRVSLFLHQQLNNCPFQYSVYQKQQYFHTLSIFHTNIQWKSNLHTNGHIFTHWAYFTQISNESQISTQMTIFSHIEHISHKYPMKVKFSHKLPYFHTLSIFFTIILLLSVAVLVFLNSW
jgi:hypothetical protein